MPCSSANRAGRCRHRAPAKFGCGIDDPSGMRVRIFVSLQSSERRDSTREGLLPLNRTNDRAGKDFSGEKFIVATEKGMVYRLRKEMPEKQFIPISLNAECRFMKANTFDKLLDSLKQGSAGDNFLRQLLRSESCRTRMIKWYTSRGRRRNQPGRESKECWRSDKTQ